MKLPSNTSESSGTDGWILEIYKWEINEKKTKYFLGEACIVSLSLN